MVLWQSSVDIVLFNDGNTDFFHTLSHLSPDQPEVLLTAMHDPNTHSSRARFWRGMQDNLPPSATPWLVMGDMNEVTNQNEKVGGRTFRHAQCSDFNNLMDNAGLVDLGFHGNQFTWSNAREGFALIRKGGLGIRNLRLQNLAFMTKSTFLDSIPHSNTSTIWKDILKGREILSKGLIMGVGDGHDISLWYHHWVGDGPIYLLLPHEVPNYIAHWRVSYIIKNGEWCLDDIAYLLPSHMIDAILAIPLSTTLAPKDFIKWRFNSSGVFSIKSAYGTSLKNPTIQSPLGCWKILWKIKAPLKYKMLLWNSFNEILPVGFVLGSKIEGFSLNCARCLNATENHLHLFRDCPSSSSFWSTIITSTNTHFVNGTGLERVSWNDWVAFNMNQSCRWRTIFTVGCWHIWLMRNKTVFDGAMLHPTSVMNCFNAGLCLTNLAFQTNLAQPLIQRQIFLWRAPQLGSYKLNIDGSWEEISKDGLLLAMHFQISRLEVKTDAKSILIMLDNAQNTTKHDLLALIIDVGNLLKLDWHITISHIKREANQVAHCLANNAYQMEARKINFQTVPDCARKAYDSDLMNIAQSSNAAAATAP
ncbi:hypothetical protein RDABS01_034370 [Bienertia sinuspersici]